MLRGTLLALGCCSFGRPTHAATLSGELKTWHRVTLTFDGPTTNGDAKPNPFLDYRLNVTFMQGE